MNKLPLDTRSSTTPDKAPRRKLTTKLLLKYSLIIFLVLIVVHTALLAYAIASGDPISVARSQVKQPDSYKINYIYSNENYASNFTIEEEREVGIAIKSRKGTVSTRLTEHPVELGEEASEENLLMSTTGESGGMFTTTLPPGTYYLDIYCHGHSGSVEVTY